MIMKTKTTSDGIVWRIVPPSAAIALFANGAIEIHALHEDGETLVRTLSKIDECIFGDIPLAISVGQIEDMLPQMRRQAGSEP